jgi:hypothetical protein
MLAGSSWTSDKPGAGRPLLASVAIRGIVGMDSKGTQQELSLAFVLACATAQVETPVV